MATTQESQNHRHLDGDPTVLPIAMAKLTAAIERGGALDPLIAQLHARQQERERLLAAMASARTVDRMRLDRAAIEATIQAQVTRWRDLLSTDSTEDGRQLLREVLAEPPVFTPTRAGYRFRGRVKTGELVAGAVNGGAQRVASPTIPSWNQIANFLASMRQLKDSVGFAA